MYSGWTTTKREVEENYTMKRIRQFVEKGDIEEMLAFVKDRIGMMQEKGWDIENVADYAVRALHKMQDAVRTASKEKK